MKIRSITYFCNPGWPLKKDVLQKAGEFLDKARRAFQEGGVEVQTTRLATIPFPHILEREKIGDTPALAEALSGEIKKNGIEYASLGPAQPDLPESYAIIPTAIAASENIFFGGAMTRPQNSISMPAIKACAQIITRCSTITADGFANLRFAALANVAPGSPFFPAAFHNRDEPTFALATEAADLAIDAFTKAKSVPEGQSGLQEKIETHAKNLTAISTSLAGRFGIGFGGIDFSLAPFPAESRSLGAAMERLGVPKAGKHGSLAAAAILTEVIDRADFLHTGFCGLMLPVLEDEILARRAAEGSLSIKDLLLYSAVCGTGLDTVPLPGDTAAESIAALLLDISALAVRLDKPLTSRLMPIPGKKAGDLTAFDFGYFSNSRVMSLEAEELSSVFSTTEDFALNPRNHISR